MEYARVTFTVPAPLKKKLRSRRDVNWSGVVAKALQERMAALDLADLLASRSRLASEHIEELAAELDKAMAKRFGVKS